MIVILSIIYMYLFEINCNGFSLHFGEELLKIGSFLTWSQLLQLVKGHVRGTCMKFEHFLCQAIS